MKEIRTCILLLYSATCLGVAGCARSSSRATISEAVLSALRDSNVSVLTPYVLASGDMIPKANDAISSNVWPLPKPELAPAGAHADLVASESVAKTIATARRCGDACGFPWEKAVVSRATISESIRGGGEKTVFGGKDPAIDDQAGVFDVYMTVEISSGKRVLSVIFKAFITSSGIKLAKGAGCATASLDDTRAMCGVLTCYAVIDRRLADMMVSSRLSRELYDETQSWVPETSREEPEVWLRVPLAPSVSLRDVVECSFTGLVEWPFFEESGDDTLVFDRLLWLIEPARIVLKRWKAEDVEITGEVNGAPRVFRRVANDIRKFRSPQSQNVLFSETNSTRLREIRFEDGVVVGVRWGGEVSGRIMAPRLR